MSVNIAKKKDQRFWLLWAIAGAAEVTFNYECCLGHTGQVSPGTDLEKRARKRLAEGYLDTMCLGSDCPQCRQQIIQSLGYEKFPVCPQCGTDDKISINYFGGWPTHGGHELFCRRCGITLK